jgi:hypothetical protein
MFSTKWPNDTWLDLTWPDYLPSKITLIIKRKLQSYKILNDSSLLVKSDVQVCIWKRSSINTTWANTDPQIKWKIQEHEFVTRRTTLRWRVLSEACRIRKERRALITATGAQNLPKLYTKCLAFISITTGSAEMGSKLVPDIYWPTNSRNTITEKLRAIQLVKHIFHILRNSKVYYHVHVRPTMDNIERRPNPLDIILHNFFTSHFNTILPSLLRSPKWSLPFKFSNWNVAYIYLPMRSTCSAYRILLDLIV